MPNDFPILRDGDELEPYHLNIIYAELKRLRKMKGLYPIYVEGMDGDDGPNVSTGVDPSSPFRIMLVTSTITAMTFPAGVPTPGSGQGYPVLRDGASNALPIPASGVLVTIYSSKEKTFIASVGGSPVYVDCLRDDNGDWWVIGVNKCSYYS